MGFNSNAKRGTGSSAGGGSGEVSSVVPTANGTYYTEEIPSNFAQFQCYLTFFSDAAGTLPVTPTAGTATFAGTPEGITYLAATNPVVNCNTVIANGLSTYTPPTITGRVKKGRVIFAGVAGAAYARITFWGR